MNLYNFVFITMTRLLYLVQNICLRRFCNYEFYLQYHVSWHLINLADNAKLNTKKLLPT